jgi:hypothetical protein
VGLKGLLASTDYYRRTDKPLLFYGRSMLTKGEVVYGLYWGVSRMGPGVMLVGAYVRLVVIWVEKVVF